MKKTSTLLAIMFLFAPALFAQYNGNHQNDNEYDNNNPCDFTINNTERRNGYNDRGGRNYYERKREIQVAQINRNYNYRIQDVRNNFFMSHYKKQRIIEALQYQRDEEIRSILKKYSHRKYHQKDYDDYYKRDR